MATVDLHRYDIWYVLVQIVCGRLGEAYLRTCDLTMTCGLSVIAKIRKFTTFGTVRNSLTVCTFSTYKFALVQSAAASGRTQSYSYKKISATLHTYFTQNIWWMWSLPSAGYLNYLNCLYLFESRNFPFLPISTSSSTHMIYTIQAQNLRKPIIE